MNELENHPFHYHSMAHYDDCYGSNDINERTKTHASVYNTRRNARMTCQDCIHYKSIGTLCDKYIYPEERNNEPCEHYVINDGSYNVYPTHGSVGNAFLTHESVGNALDALDSWESVSK